MDSLLISHKEIENYKNNKSLIELSKQTVETTAQPSVLNSYKRV